MKTLAAFLSEQGEITIHTLAEYIGQCIDEQWQPVWQRSEPEMQRFFDRSGEPAYGVYGRALFRPIQEQLTHAGFLSEPGFPGRQSFRPDLRLRVRAAARLKAGR